MLDDLITPHSLFKLAGDKAFLRGEAYFSDRAVRHLVADTKSVTAWVSGTQDYQVVMSDDAGELAWECDCPRAADGYFCKHCVAVGLTWLAQRARADDSDAEENDWSRIQAYLANLSHDDLIAMVLELARRDENLLQTLSLKSQRNNDKQLAALRQAIDQATTLNPRHGWGYAGDYLVGMERVVDALGDLRRPAMAVDLLDLCEYAFERVERLLEQVDEDGSFNQVLADLSSLHRDASLLANLVPAELAQRLFELEMTGHFEYVQFEFDHYREALGEAGLLAYREMAEAAWAESSPANWRLARLMEQMARESGDVDALLAVKARDLSSGWRYLEIAKILSAAGRDDEALEWAERGWQAYPKNPDDRLRDFLIEAYLQRKRSNEAVQLAWMLFVERPWLDCYKKLQKVAKQAGVWPEQRQLALAQVEKRAAQATHSPAGWFSGAATRLEIAVWEKDLDTAWNLTQQMDCAHSLLVELAGLLQASRVDDAITLYKRVIPVLVAQTNNRAYEEATALVRRIASLLREHERSPEFIDYLIALRSGFKNKRNFMKLLNQLI